MEPKELSSEAA